ncbi:Transmembrane protein [Melia azedarach]|uniref:Transmembrane protein n=1 Tax=Melia azedarach TaxID=155640 RepID=A0ACC1WZ11_MELAZ|nr:Transmembrane protein [Melia azedarach]
MEMADNSKLDMASSCEACGLKENASTQKITLLDHLNGFQYNAAKKSDNFVIDMETFSHGAADKDITANSRITMQRNLSRKGSLRSGGAAPSPAEKKTNSVANDKDTVATTGPSTPEKPAVAAVGSTDQSSGPHVHHQITITTGNIITTPDSRAAMKRNSFNFKRSSSPWAIDPKRVLFFFATLSSMGTILLIYFTLSIKSSANANNFD